MKIRQGFVSNSSSSSFIIRWTNMYEFTDDNGKIDKGAIKQWVIDRILTSAKNNPPAKDSGWEKIWTQEELEKYIVVGTVADLYKELEYWYAPCFLDSKSDIVIYGKIDNVIPYEVCQKIMKKFFLVEFATCNLHQG